MLRPFRRESPGCAGRIEMLRGSGHLDHEDTSPQFVARTNAGEDPIGNATFAARAGTKLPTWAISVIKVPGESTCSYWPYSDR